ncbi:hypothetical protein B6N60_04697 [Richelia sinica FACHB-800]|uniref:Uncharacterized protein n=1 Tax=Richelia sinica FACHB-800 TaxID=1357546 RepID=A0A975TC12_9NOST|nr:hypothetical protein B6N60_04697 [Richelia sinica FACHB-800]
MHHKHNNNNHYQNASWLRVFAKNLKSLVTTKFFSYTGG